MWGLTGLPTKHVKETSLGSLSEKSAGESAGLVFVGRVTKAGSLQLVSISACPPVNFHEINASKRIHILIRFML